MKLLTEEGVGLLPLSPPSPLPFLPTVSGVMLLDELVKGSATCHFLIFKMRSNAEVSPEN